MRKKTNNMILSSMREIVFGFEDGVVSTLGVVTGIAEGTQDRFTILLAGVVVIAVESLSMAAGTYLSSKSEEQALAKKNHKSLQGRNLSKATRGAAVMGLVYVVGGTIPVLPYLFVPIWLAIISSVLVAIVMLFLMGVWKAKLTDTPMLSGGIEMVFVSLSAAGLGFFIGWIASNLYPNVKVSWG